MHLYPENTSYLDTYRRGPDRFLLETDLDIVNTRATTYACLYEKEKKENSVHSEAVLGQFILINAVFPMYSLSRHFECTGL